MFIQGEKISLRALEPGDVKLLYIWENDPVIWRISQTLKPYSEYTLQMFVDCATDDIFTTRQIRLMVDLKNENPDEPKTTIGIVDLFDYDPFNQRIGLGILIHQDYRRQGFATEAIELIKKYVFETLLIHQIYCNVQQDNKTSLILFEATDFEIIGLQKDWLRTVEGFKNVYLLQCINPNNEIK